MNARKSVGALASLIVVTVTASALLAFATIDAPPLPVKPRKPHAGVTTEAPAPVAAAPAVAPVAEKVAAPPPKPAAAPAPPPERPTISIDELRTRAGHNDVAAMEELGRRLLQGVDVPKDPQAGAGWLLRAANLGSAQSAFNIGVMYERGFVVERDSSKAAEWYRKAADGGLPTAKHNLALMLRDGKGTPRDVKGAIQMFLSAAHQGMAASMFSLGDIYEKGDGGTRDAPAALAWFAITGEFERRTNRDGETALAKAAGQRAQVLKRTLTTAELERAQELAQGEFKRIMSEISPPPAPSTPSVPPPEPAPAIAAVPQPVPGANAALDWPKSPADQVRVIQQALLDLKRLRSTPDGALGPLTRAAIRDFQKDAGLRPTGEPSRELYAALLSARNDIVRASPLPAPPPTVVDTTKPAATKVETAKADSSAWPANRSDQMKAIQVLLRDMRLYSGAIDGQPNGATQAAIRAYQRSAGLKETGDADKALFDSLTGTRLRMMPAPN
jgi:peptidoglycan hydrolase-like protein with peptidoglycan-binding domain